MKKTEKQESLLLQLLKEMAQGDTLDSVVQSLRLKLGEDAPTAAAVQRYLLQPNDTASLDACQRALVIDQLLEYAEINFRTLCGLIRYRHLKAAGMVSSVEEFLALTRLNEMTDLREENSE